MDKKKNVQKASPKKAIDFLENVSWKAFGLEILVTLAGSFIFALSVHFFTAPNRIAPGGITGLATIVNALFPFIPLGGLTVAFNIPIMIVGFFHLGKRFMFKTLLSLGSFTIFTDYILKSWPTYTNDKFLAAIFGGVLMGLGIGLMFSGGGSSGGMDIVNKIISKRLPHLKLGRITFMSDLVVVTVSAIAFKSVEPALYALVALYVSSLAIDMVLYGFNVCKFIYIITEQADTLSEKIIEEMHRGATILRSYGAYTKQDKPTVMVAVRQNEYYRLKKLVQSVDPSAFMIVTAANEIVGKGFAKLD